MYTATGHRSDLPLASVVVRTARTVLGLTPDDVAAAAGCDVGLVERIESGEHDPVMDTVERLLNSVGLEMRCGPRPVPNPAYLQVDPTEVQRLKNAIGEAREFWAQFDRPPPCPPPGTRLEWDGQPPAPCRLFGAGPGRRHEGGWAAILISSLRWEQDMTADAMADAVGVDVAELARIEAGEQRPTMTDVQRFMTAVGQALSVRVEVYDTHDDGLHLSAIANPEQVAATIRHARKVFGAAISG